MRAANPQPRRARLPFANRRRAAGVLLAALALLGLGASGATAAEGKRTVRFDGRSVEVPKGWQVLRLAERPRICVRLDRRVVYLGAPSPRQRCPAAAAVGRQRAILVEPSRRARGSALPRSATRPRRGAGATASAAGTIFTGLGFDACTAPSSRSMAAWASSPYRAIGVYIGGLNRACSQPNLTASWVGAQTAAGWHLIPTYVGLQAPTSSCSSCAKLSPSQAVAQGSAEALDAVADAAAVGIGPGNPIYFDMESYTQTSSATAATLAFLEAWTKKLHSLGYTSGVYSSSASGIEDLVSQLGQPYELPDHLWIANWNGRADTYDPVVPAYAWSQHQRIHQYRGGHNETWGGMTINIDNNYVDASTVGSAVLASPDDPIGWLDGTGSPRPGHLRVRGWAFDPNAPTAQLAVRVSVGGPIGSRGAATYELGPAALARGDVAAAHPEAGRDHGFDATIPTTKSGRQRVCVYAVGIAPGGDRMLGCEATRIGPAVTFRRIRKDRRGVRVRVRCEWPAGTACPGRLILRTRFKVTQRRAGRARTKVVRRALGRRPFRLVGGRAHTFKLRYNSNGRRLLNQRGRLRSQLIAAIPGGRRVQVLRVESGGR